MHKCPECGQEYDGKFCPNCGAQWLGEKTCPTCGAKLEGSARFCTECGYSFVKTAQGFNTCEVAYGSSREGSSKKRFLKFIIIVIFSIALTLAMIFITPRIIQARYNGTYYSVKTDGEFDRQSYFTIKTNVLTGSCTWTNEANVSGNCKMNGSSVVLYVELFGETIELCSGTFNNYVLKLDFGFGTQAYAHEKHDHSFGGWMTEISATCLSEGTERRECYDCGGGSTRKTEKLSHSLSDWQYDEQFHYKVCVVCESQVDIGEHSGEDVCDICGYDLYESVGLEFLLSSNKNYYIVCGLGTVTKKDIVIPETYKGLPVTEIAKSAFSECYQLTSIIIPESVTSIGSAAFKACTALKSITIPNSVTEIGKEAFYCCSSLTDIVIPSGIKKIEDYLFFGCSSLKEIIIPDGVTVIGASAFYNCSAINDITIPNGVQTIGSSAFCKCYSLTSITIPSSVDLIGKSAFAECDAIKSVTFENTAGWWRKYDSLSTGKNEMKSEELRNNATAALYLTNTYCNFIWFKEQA